MTGHGHGRVRDDVFGFETNRVVVEHAARHRLVPDLLVFLHDRVLGARGRYDARLFGRVHRGRRASAGHAASREHRLRLARYDKRSDTYAAHPSSSSSTRAPFSNLSWAKPPLPPPDRRVLSPTRKRWSARSSGEVARGGTHDGAVVRAEERDRARLRLQLASPDARTSAASASRYTTTRCVPTTGAPCNSDGFFASASRCDELLARAWRRLAIPPSVAPLCASDRPATVVNRLRQRLHDARASHGNRRARAAPP